MTSKNKQDFMNEFKQLIQNEIKENHPVTGKITKIEDENLEISIEKPINISNNIPIKIDHVNAQLIKNKYKKLHVQIDENDEFTLFQKVKVHNSQRTIIIKKLQEILNNIQENKLNEENLETLNIILDDYDPKFKKIRYQNARLNSNQSKAIQNSLSSNKFHLIQGPPGTGKTHTIIRLVEQLYKKGNKILITAHTHIAIDNILERLVDIPDNEILRLGQKVKIDKNSYKYTLNNQIKNHRAYTKIQDKEKQIKELSISNKIINPQTTENNKLSFLLNRLIGKKEQSIEYQYDNNDKIQELEDEIESIKLDLRKNIIKTSSIIATTVLSSSNYLTKDLEFDYVIMDEASQVPLYLALIPLLKTKNFILIGDNKQLQPITNDNASYFLNKSIFNILIDKYPGNYSFLNIQYRMNQRISDVASKLYYENKLKTSEHSKDNHLKIEKYDNILVNSSKISFIDTSKLSFYESNVTKGCCNKYESEIILSIIKFFIKNNIEPDEIGVITPYRKQKQYTRKLLDENSIKVEVDTIYRFQGREKDVIIMNFCKSSMANLTKFQKEFLSNKNQLNVSITRSRKKLILIGNLTLLNQSDNIKELVNLINPSNIIYLSDMLL